MKNPHDREGRPSIQFSYGRVIRYHEIGRYDIVEFLDPFSFKEEAKKRNINFLGDDPSRALREITVGREVNEDVKAAYEASIRFAVYVDGKDAHVFSLSLEGALVLAIARAHHDVNVAGHAARFALQILGGKSDYT